jgi:hypothetical protein
VKYGKVYGNQPHKGDFMARGNNFITEVRNANKQVWDGINNLVELQREWNALDYGSTLANGVGSNEGIAASFVGAVAFDSANAFVTVLNAGHATNMAKLL